MLGIGSIRPSWCSAPRLTAALGLAALTGCAARRPAEEGPPARAALGEVVALVESHVFDPRRLDSRWRSAVEEHRARWERAASPDERASLLRSLLASLGLSHTAYYTPDQPAWTELLDLFRAEATRDAVARLFPDGVALYETIGIVATEIEGAHFVADVLEGTPAERAGLRAGDRLLAVAELRRPGATGSGARTIERLLLQAEPDDPSPRTVDVERISIQPEELFLLAQRASARIVERAGRHIAYVHLRSWASQRFQELLEEQLLEGELAGADALVLDLRGGWGGADPGYLALFDPRAPELELAPRGAPPARIRRAWTRPVVLLVDGTTRSGKEVLVRAFRRHGIGPVVGERTAGAVLGGRPFVLRDGSLLLLAVSDVLVDGERLEGLGVEPDLLVPRELAYCAGRDSPLEAALDEAARLAAQ